MAQEGSDEQPDRKELLANIRRLTIAVLDNLEQGSKDKTLDQGEKRLLSSTGARLLRLWKSALKDELTCQTAGRARRRKRMTEESSGTVS
jgi:hypothetical protein